MTKITSIKLGVIVMCIATVPWSLAQRPRTATNGSNQPVVTTPALAGHSGLSGNSTSAAQPGTILPSRPIAGANTNAGARIGINAGAQTAISNQPVGITGSAAGGLAGSSGNLMGARETGANAGTGTNTTANTNARAHTAAAAATAASVSNIQPQFIPVPTPSPLFNNNALSPNFSTPGQSTSPLPSASPTPTSTPPGL
jgi:hypothetical protein